MFHRPSSGVACLCKVCLLFKKVLKVFESLYHNKKGSESARDNFGKFISQFQPETLTLIRKLERIFNKLYRQNLSLSFNETYLNKRLLPNHTHTHAYIYIYVCVCVCVCVCIYKSVCVIIFILY